MTLPDREPDSLATVASARAVAPCSIDGEVIHISGIVQGVGFRPTVWRLAIAAALKGTVYNDGHGVVIEVRGDRRSIDRFIDALKTSLPPLARIDGIRRTPLGAGDFPDGFSIAASQSNAVNTAITPDAAVCTDCLADCADPFGRRYRYPLTNCTHCGPRFSIVNAIPYDRENTSMLAFQQCQTCLREYTSPADRRFHAQPNACYDCGPEVTLERLDGKPVCLETLSQLDAVDAACTLLQNGELIAIKGIGGFHLACDATNDAAVRKLRAAKQRFAKPFALMARDMEVIHRYAIVSDTEEALLCSPEAPIVLLPKHHDGPAGTVRRFGDQAGFRAADLNDLSAAIAPGLKQYGFMLPYTPMHYLMLKRMNRPIVLTSGNLSDEPQCLGNDEARTRLSAMVDFVLWHNRDIVNRVDDSVARVIGDKPRLLRRSRGYAPAPLPLPPGFPATTAVLAMGGELKNTFCLGKDRQLILSQHIGDLEDATTYQDYQNNLDLYARLFDHRPGLIVVDRHPEYLSGKWGRTKSNDDGIPLLEVQHHHAHIAACLAENNWPINGGKVLGVALDGLGYGDDGELWGGEFLLADYAGYERLATFKPVAMLGGTQAMREPWRNTYAHLMAEIGWAGLKMNFAELELMAFLESKPLASYDSMLKSGLNSPMASSCGRLFDAVAAAIGLCREQARFEGEAAIRLEAIVDQHALFNEDEALAYPFAAPRLNHTGLPYIEPLAMWQALLGDLILKTPAGVISARFHRGLARGIVAMIERLTTKDEQRWVNTVALSGGVFQNRVLFEEVHRRLSALDYQILSHAHVPANDGCLALGQAVIGLAQSNLPRSQ